MRFSSPENEDLAKGIVLGIVLGIIVAFLATEVSNVIHRQSDFYIDGPTSVPDVGGDGSFSVNVNNLHKIYPKYPYQIALIGYEVDANGVPKYLSQQSEGITLNAIDPFLYIKFK